MRIAKGGAPPWPRVAEHARRGPGFVKVREPKASSSSHLQELVAGRLASTSATLRRGRRGGRPLKSSQLGLESADLAVELLLDHGVVVLEKFGDPIGGRRADRGPEVEELLLDHGVVVLEKVGDISSRSAGRGDESEDLVAEGFQSELGRRGALREEASTASGREPAKEQTEASRASTFAENSCSCPCPSSWHAAGAPEARRHSSSAESKAMVRFYASTGHKAPERSQITLGTDASTEAGEKSRAAARRGGASTRGKSPLGG